MPLNRFDILSSAQSLDGHRLLEASAGTGKTFAIENYIVRLLLEGDLMMDQALVLTFTKAAANDLRGRIRDCLEKTDALLRNERGDGVPDYLLPLFAEGGTRLQIAAQKIRLNLYSFENASIYTLHAFCQKVLAEEGLLDPACAILKKSEMHQRIVDFLRTELDPDWIHPDELEYLWKKSSKEGSTEKVIGRIENEVSKGTMIAPQPSFKECFEAFCKLFEENKETAFEQAKIMEDFDRILPCCKNVGKIRDKLLSFSFLMEQGPTPENYMKWIEFDYALFSKLSPSNYKKESTPPKGLHYPKLLDWVEKSLAPFAALHHVQEKILLRLAGGVQKNLRKYMSQVRRYTYDEMLQQMGEAVQIPAISEALRNRNRLVIVDEFQDTDPVQWKILKRLFLNPDHPWSGRLVLVGDPKQSIYAFRQADIYTYLDASNALGPEALASLDTNFRSHPKLVAGLNKLFDKNLFPKLIPLPKTGSYLDCPPVRAGLAEEGLTLLPRDEVGIEVAFIGNKTPYIEYIAGEILRMHNAYGVPFGACAILIKDHIQGQAIAKVLKSYKIPFTLQKEKPLQDSAAFSALKELFVAILHCRDLKLIKIALAGSIMRWSYKEILQLEDPELLAEVLQKFAHWNHLFHTAGFAACFENVMDSSSYGTELLRIEGGEEFLTDLLHSAEWLMNKQGPQHLMPEEFLELFREQPVAEEEDEASSPSRHTSGEGAVTLVTIHSSKGLEYPIVFAPGVDAKANKITSIVTHQQGEERSIVAVERDSEAFLLYCEENNAEKMRQFYVAATRAKYKLVLFAKESKNNSSQSHEISLMQLYLLQAIGESHTVSAIESFFLSIDNGEGAVRFKKVEPTVVPTTVFSVEPARSAILTPPPSFKPSFQPLYISSFTSISSHGPSFNMEMPAPQEVKAAVKTPHTLPAGADTGTLLHGLFEKIEFDLLRDPEALDDALKCHLQYHPLADWNEVIAEIVHAAMHTSLDGFCLKDVAPDRAYKEAEFLYAAHQPELMKGVIDLFFMHEGKYYLLDWKSNWLGPDASYYGPSHLQEAMQAHQYLLQAQIYCEALKRYLKLVDPRPFEDCFGGIYYLFLRGLPEGKGVFYARSL